MKGRVFNAALHLAEQYGRYITLGGGEPTLHPLFERYLLQAIASSPQDIAPFVVTNGLVKRRALMLAKLAESGAVDARLSWDDHHPHIDDEVIEAFRRAGKALARQSMMDRGWVTASHRADDEQLFHEVENILPYGRAVTNNLAGDDTGCICDDWFIKPDGSIYQCGCQITRLGNVLDKDHEYLSYLENACERENKEMDSPDED